MILTLHTLTTVDATETVISNGLPLEDRKKLLRKGTAGQAIIFVDADMSATGTPNYDVQLNFVGTNGVATIADTSTLTALTTDGIYFLEPAAGFMAVGVDTGPTFLPFLDGVGKFTVTTTENSGTGSIVLATVYAIIPD